MKLAESDRASGIVNTSQLTGRDDHWKENNKTQAVFITFIKISSIEGALPPR